jgi:tetratricopeptide (TPR) repeat protein
MPNLTEREVAAFVGPNAGFYLKKWHARLEETGSETGFNWAAFFLAGVWLVYRKLYAGAAIFFGIIVLESMLEVWLGMPRAVLYLGSLAVSLIFGACGNYWYFSRAQKAVARVRRLRLTHDDDLQTLARLGGTNSAAAWTVYFVIVALVLLFSEIHLDSVVGIAIEAPSLLLCAVWFLTPSHRRERICQIAGGGCVVAVAGLLVWERVSAELRIREAARLQEAQKKEATQAAQRVKENQANAADLARERDGHREQAVSLGTKGRYAEALEHWDRALALQGLLGSEPAPEGLVGQLRQGRALALAQAGEHARATAEAAELAGANPITGDSLYELACVYSLSAGAAGATARLAKSEQDQGVREYAVRAVELLTRAQGTGFFRTAANLDRVMTDPRLDPLRSQPLFKNLMKSHDLGRLVAEHCLDHALSLGDEGKRQLALLWFARGLEMAPADASDLARALRANLAAWHGAEALPLARLRHPGKIHAVAFTNDGKTLVTICGTPPEDRTKVQLCAQLWDAGNGKEIARNLIPATAVTAVALSADGGTFTVDDNEDRFLFWDSATGKAVGRPVNKISGRSYGRIALSQDGSLLFAQNSIWQVATGRPLKLAVPFFHPLASSADAKTLVVYVGNYDFALFRLPAGERVGPGFGQEGTGGLGDVAALSADASRVMTAGDTILVWQAATGQPIGPAIRFRSLRALAFSPDGATVLTGGGQVPDYGGPAYLSFAAAQLWDVSTGKPTGPPFAHQGWVQAAAFSPDGSRLLTGSHDKSTYLWKVPHFVEGEVERLVVWVQLDTDTTLDEHGQPRRLDNKERAQCRKRLQELGGPPPLK